MGFAVRHKLPNKMPKPDPPVEELCCESCGALAATRDRMGRLYVLRRQRWEVFEPIDDSMKSYGRLYQECPKCGDVNVFGETPSLF